jgi:ElaB/YqjD/DUF883 family membrane-anchored ribosome-binding protein
MADQPEVIQHELDETRSALAEKLGAIGEKISGTVENVTDSVENVTQAVENTVEAVTGTVEAVGETAQETVEAVKQAFNFKEQYQNHPWLFFGGSVALGFIGGKLLSGFSSRRERSFEPMFHSGSNGHGNGHANTYSGRAAENFFEENAPARAAQASAPSDQGKAQARETQSSSWLGKVAEQFGPQLNTLKGLALGSLFGVARDMITQAMPSNLKSELVNVFDSITETAGGKPIHGAILEEEPQEGFGPTKGEDREKPNRTEMDRPVGSTQGKGQAGMGKSHGR